MTWFWLAFFALVALLLFIDLGVLHRKNEEQSLRTAALWTVGWMILGLSFSGVVFLMFENHWLGAALAHGDVKAGQGSEAAVTYVSAYLLEQALSIDNIFVISLLFAKFKVPSKYQYRILFWGIMGAIVFRVTMLGGGVWLAQKFDWIFYIFGGYLAWQGIGLLREGDDDDDPTKSAAVRMVRRVVRVVDGDHGGKFLVRQNGRRALTMIALCLISIELTDIVFALDSIPAVLSVSDTTFIVISSNIFAIMGLRSMYFVLAGAMAKFEYLKVALAVLLVGIGVKMCLHSYVHISHVVSLIAIAGIIGAGVAASLVLGKDKPEGEADAEANEPGPTSPSP
jgi:tellurite resistance protein TerC